MSIDIDGLAKAIAQHTMPAVPLDKQWWSARQVGAYLDLSARTVTEKLSYRPGFPEASRIPSERGKGTLRWRASEVIAWMESV